MLRDPRTAPSTAWAGATVVCLLPARTNTAYWHDYCFKGEVRFIRGYPKFGNAKQGLKVPLAVVVFRPPKDADPATADLFAP